MFFGEKKHYTPILSLFCAVNYSWIARWPDGWVPEWLGGWISLNLGSTQLKQLEVEVRAELTKKNQ